MSSTISSTEKKRRFIVFALLGLTIAIVILFASVMLFAPDKPATNSKVVGARASAIDGSAGGVGSAEYNNTLKEHDRQKAEEALHAGESFMPTPVGQQRPIVAKKEDTPPPPPPVAPVRTAPVTPPKTDNALLKRMMDDLSKLDTRLTSATVGTGQIIYTREFPEEVAQTPEITQAIATASTPTLTLKTGDMLYAIVDIGVNSDVPSAVMATVATGTYKNMRLIGSFQRFEERLVLTFSRAILASGQSVQLEAYAVDPRTTEASVASSVDTHFFSRWGGLIASSFLAGLGEATQMSGAESTTTYPYSTSSNILFNTYSLEEQMLIAAGSVGEKASEVFEKNFDRVPTVYLESGSAIGVLILNVETTK